MSAVIGLLLFTIAVLTLGASLLFARRPNAPVWLTDGIAATLITITTIASAAIGLGLVVQFALSYGREPLSSGEVVLISTSLIVLTIVFAVIGRALNQQAQQPPETLPFGTKVELSSVVEPTQDRR